MFAKMDVIGDALSLASRCCCSAASGRHHSNIPSKESKRGPWAGANRWGRGVVGRCLLAPFTASEDALEPPRVIKRACWPPAPIQSGGHPMPSLLPSPSSQPRHLYRSMLTTPDETKPKQASQMTRTRQKSKKPGGGTYVHRQVRCRNCFVVDGSIEWNWDWDLGFGMGLSRPLAFAHAAGLAWLRSNYSSGISASIQSNPTRPN